jgi:hypothetical protein
MFASPFKFGLPGKELSMSGTVEPWSDSISINFGRQEAINQNVIGESFARVHRRLQAGYRVRVVGASELQMLAMKSISMQPHSFLSFIYAGPHQTISQRYIMETNSTFKLTSDSMLRLDQAYFNLSPPGAAQVTGIKVFKDYDALGAQVSNDYFLSFNRADWTVTIDTGDPSPPIQGEEVFATWSYTGALVRVESFSASHSERFEGTDPKWEVQLSLRGV